MKSLDSDVSLNRKDEDNGCLNCEIKTEPRLELAEAISKEEYEKNVARSVKSEARYTGFEDRIKRSKKGKIYG